ncbi:MAG: hypothetical protein ACOH2H_18770 [Cypionkella sp.]
MAVSASLSFTAAAIRHEGGPFPIEHFPSVTIKDNEVRGRVVASGMSHTDMIARDCDSHLPHLIVLGCEGSKVVKPIGSRVQIIDVGCPSIAFLDSDGHREGHPAFCKTLTRIISLASELTAATRLQEMTGQVEGQVLRAIILWRLCHCLPAPWHQGSQGRPA